MRETSSKTFTGDIALGKVLVDCYATWCGPCIKQKDILEELSTMHPDVDIVSLDIEKEPDLVASLGVRGLPTLFLYEAGTCSQTFVGLTSLEKLQLAISSQDD